MKNNLLTLTAIIGLFISNAAFAEKGHSHSKDDHTHQEKKMSGNLENARKLGDLVAWELFIQVEDILNPAWFLKILSLQNTKYIDQVCSNLDLEKKLEVFHFLSKGVRISKIEMEKISSLVDQVFLGETPLEQICRKFSTENQPGQTGYLQNSSAMISGLLRNITSSQKKDILSRYAYSPMIRELSLNDIFQVSMLSKIPQDQIFNMVAKLSNIGIVPWLKNVIQHDELRRWSQGAPKSIRALLESNSEEVPYSEPKVVEHVVREIENFQASRKISLVELL